MLFVVAHALIPPVVRAAWRPRVEGAEHVPATGPVILASNHLSFADSIVLPVVAPRKVAFLAKEEYFTGTGVRGYLQRGWFEGLGMVPVNRSDTRAAMASLSAARHVLEAGGAFGVYPEGTRSRDGRLYRGRVGVAELVLATGARVVPVGLIGTDRLQPIGDRFPRVFPGGGSVTVRFGACLDLAEEFADLPPGRARREITDRIMARIAALSGQQQAGVYNQSSSRSG